MAPFKNLNPVLFGDVPVIQQTTSPEGTNGSISNSKARRIVPATLW
jgi:hypothetical protein